MQKEAEKMNLNGAGKLLNNKKLQMAAGAYIYYDAIAKQWGGTAWQEIEDKLKKALSQPHFPDLAKVSSELTSGTASLALKQLFKLWLVGYGLKTVGIGAKYGNIAQKWAENMAKGTVGAVVLGFSTSWNSPIPGTAPSTAQNFLKAPAIGVYEY